MLVTRVIEKKKEVTHCSECPYFGADYGHETVLYCELLYEQKAPNYYLHCDYVNTMIDPKCPLMQEGNVNEKVT